MTDDWQWPWPCERCECANDAMTAVGRRQLCTDCRQALDLCTMCAAPTLSGEWWCPECELTFSELVLV